MMRSPSKREDVEAKYDVVLDCECATIFSLHCFRSKLARLRGDWWCVCEGGLLMLRGGRTVNGSLPHLHSRPDLISHQPVPSAPNFILHSHLHVMVADMILLSPT